jgi:TolB-like protein/Tfp pilus assembly protein PilF
MGVDEAGTLAALKGHREELFDPKAAQYRGRTVKLMGDGALMEFASVVDAVSFAVEVQAAMVARNEGVAEDQRIVFRIGINIGDIIVEGDDIYGDGVNVAARIEGLAEPSGICVARNVFDQVKNKLDLNIEHLGEREVKNIAEPVTVYRVELDDKAAALVTPVVQEATKPVTRRWVFAATAAVVLVAAFGGMLWWQPWTPDVVPASIEKMAVTLLDKPSIAVLPFLNMSDDPSQEYFSDGITEDIMTGLSRFGLFFVISRNSTFAYKDKSVNVKDVARDLGSQYVLEGSVRKSGDRVRITAQLIDAIADKHVWAEKYDRELKDVFQVQDEITQSIVTSVAPEYLSAELRRAQRKEEPNLDAWDAFMRGYWHHMRFTKDDNAIAQGLLRKAIDLDSRQANYHALLAVTHLIAGLYGWSESKDASYREALEIAERGLALDDQDSQVIRSAGLVHFFSKNHEVALGYYERAVAANPYEAENRALLGAALGVAGDYEAALEQFEMALRLSPRDVHVATWYNYMGIAAFVAGRHEEAADWAKKTADANPQFPAGHRTLAASYGNLGRLAEAEAARERLQELLPHLTIAQLRESLPYFKNSDDLERYLDGLRKAGLPE